MKSANLCPYCKGTGKGGKYADVHGKCVYCLGTGFESGKEIKINEIVGGVIYVNQTEWLYDEIEVNGIISDCLDCFSQDTDECDFCDGPYTYFFGMKPDKDGQYFADPEAEFSGILYDDGAFHIIKSKWACYCAPCSPCAPGQGSIIEEGKIMAYGLPPNIFGDMNHEAKQKMVYIGENVFYPGLWVFKFVEEGISI